MDKSDLPARKDKTKKTMKAAGLYLIVILILTLLSSTIDDLFVPEISLVKIQKGRLNTGFEMNGFVSYGDKKKIFAPCDSHIAKLYVKPGDEITSGMPLAEIEPEDLKIKTNQYELQIMQLEDYISSYKDTYTLRTLPGIESRLDGLTREKSSIERELLLGNNTPENVDLLNNHYAEVLNEIDLAQKEKEFYENDYSRVTEEKSKELEILKKGKEAWESNIGENGTVCSDISGTILTVAYGEGEKTIDGQMMFEIIEKDSLAQIICNLSTEQSSQLKIGDTLKASLKEYKGMDNGNRTEYVQIDEISCQAEIASIEFDDQVQGVKLRCNVKPEKGILLEGDPAKLEYTGTSTVFDFVVPNSALSSGSDSDCVYSVSTRYGWLGKEEYIVYKIPVSIVKSDMINSAIYAEGLSGLSVITDCTIPLEDGMRVKVK